MYVKDIMTKPVQRIDKNTSIAEVIIRMCEENISSFVVEHTEKEYGIITRKDIVNRVVACNKDLRKTKVKDIATIPLLTVTSEHSIVDVARLMTKTNIRRFPVVENGKLVGIVSNSDILKWGIKNG